MSIDLAFAFAVAVIVAVETIITSSPAPGMTPPTQEAAEFQFPPAAVLVIVAAKA